MAWASEHSVLPRPPSSSNFRDRTVEAPNYNRDRGVPKGMNFHPILGEAEAQGIADVTAFLREELPERWMAEYKEATARPRTS